MSDLIVADYKYGFSKPETFVILNPENVILDLIQNLFGASLIQDLILAGVHPDSRFCGNDRGTRMTMNYKQIFLSRKEA